MSGIQGHNRKRKSHRPGRLTEKCDNCGGAPVFRYHYGGTVLCRKCAESVDDGVLSWDEIHRQKDSRRNSELNSPEPDHDSPQP